MSVVVEIGKLVVPLSDNPEGILDECANNQKPSYSWYISTPNEPLNQRPLLSHMNCVQAKILAIDCAYSRFYGICCIIQPFFNLVRLLSQLL